MFSLLTILCLNYTTPTKPVWQQHWWELTPVQAKGVQLSSSTMERTIKTNKHCYGVVLTLLPDKYDHNDRHYLFLSTNKQGADVIKNDLNKSINAHQEIDLNSYSAFQMGRGNQVKGQLVLPQELSQVKLSPTMSREQLSKMIFKLNLAY